MSDKRACADTRDPVPMDDPPCRMRCTIHNPEIAALRERATMKRLLGKLACLLGIHLTPVYAARGWPYVCVRCGIPFGQASTGF